MLRCSSTLATALPRQLTAMEALTCAAKLHVAGVSKHREQSYDTDSHAFASWRDAWERSC